LYEIIRNNKAEIQGHKGMQINCEAVE
jgi:hypothetical protein